MKGHKELKKKLCDALLYHNVYRYSTIVVRFKQLSEMFVKWFISLSEIFNCCFISFVTKTLFLCYIMGVPLMSLILVVHVSQTNDQLVQTERDCLISVFL